MTAHPTRVRVAGENDLHAVLRVHARRDPNAYDSAAPSTEVVSTWATMMATPGLTVYLAERGAEPVGTATLMSMPNLTYRCAPTAFIEAVVVVPERRREGIATALLARLLDDARAAGCNKVQLLSHKRHATDGAHRLYEKLGFEPEAEGFRCYLRHVPPAVAAARSRP